MVLLGGTNGPETDVPASSLNAYNLEAQAKQKEQIAFLEDLSNSNFELKQILGPVIDKIEGSRRPGCGTLRLTR